MSTQRMPNSPLGSVLQCLFRKIGSHPRCELSDAQLLERFLKGEESAFETLVQRHGRLVWQVCQRVLQNPDQVEDAFQATFLVLVRKAGSVVKKQSVSSWLHGVAFRVSLKARARAAQQRRLERHRLTMSPTEITDLPATGELKDVLDAELCQLPEKFRSPLILCYLQGKSNEEAALELGCPTGSMWWRLQRGLKLMRNRLSKRGVALSIGSLAVLLAEQSADAGVPATVTLHTVRVATALAKQGTFGAASAEAAALAQEVLRSMYFAKLRLLAIVVVVVGFAGAGAAAFYGRGEELANPPSAVAANPASDPEPAKPQAATAVRGLKLELSSDKTELRLQRDGQVEAAAHLRFTMTNCGEQNLKVKMPNPNSYWGKLQLEVNGPDRESVGFDAAPLEPSIFPGGFFGDFPATKQITSPPVPFPGKMPIGTYSLKKPGVYRLRLIYTNYDKEPPATHLDSWTGAVSSNEVLLKVLPATDR